MTAVEAISLVTPVYRNEDTLAALVEQVASALSGRHWRLRFVVDASPDGSLPVARRLAASDSRLRVTALARNAGQHLALAAGLAEETDATAWVCLDADLQDPPGAVPALLDRLAEGDVGAVFAGRRGRYEDRVRLAGGRLHRAVLSRLIDVPTDAGAFVAMTAHARDAVVRLQAPSLVAAIGVSAIPTTSVPVERSARPSGSSAWRSSARLRQSAKTLGWVVHQRARPSYGTTTGDSAERTSSWGDPEPSARAVQTSTPPL